MNEQQNPVLDGQALGRAESIVMGIAGSAPAYSIAATLTTLVAAVGVLAPASLLYCGMVMLGVGFAFLHLTRLDPSAGSSYAWVRRAFHPALGFLTGWTMLVMSAIFMVSGTIPTATATLSMIAPALADRTAAVTLTAAVWMLLITGIVLKGIKLSSYFQLAMTLVEVAVLAGLVGLGLATFASHPAHALTWPVIFGQGFNPDLFASGALIAVFFFAGWDVTANLNEETRDPGRNAGPAAVIAMTVLLALFAGFAVVCLLALDDQQIQDAGINVVLAVANRLLPAPWSYAAVIAVMLSTVGTLETNILQFTRTLFAMARAGEFDPRYARLHARFRTPWLATLTVTGIGLVLLALSSWLPSIAVLMKDCVNAIGLQVAFYYSLSCAASAWDLRKARAVEAIVTGIVWPLLSGVFLIAVAVVSLPGLDGLTQTVGLGGMLIGIVPLAWGRWRFSRTAAEPENS